MNQLDRLRALSTVVADTGDFHQLLRYAPRDATTNPTLILRAARQDLYRPLLAETVAAHAGRPLAAIAEALLVRFGREILQRVPGRVSTEVDARLAFDAPATTAAAQRLVALYDEAGVPRSRVLIKLAATWEGIAAARVLEREGIHCNLTLVFCLAQAQACADAGVRLISPFVGRITDWHRAAAGSAWNPAAHEGANDPGVQSVRRIFAHYKAQGIATEVMAASFRSTAQVLALAGCDLLTISPELLQRLQAQDGPVARALDADAHPRQPPLPALDESGFRDAVEADAMASDKLAEGVRGFAADADQLDALIAAGATRPAQARP